MKKLSCVAVFSCFCVFVSFACGDGILIGGEEKPAPVPPGNSIWRQTIDSKYGHYNVRVETSANDCEFKYPGTNDDWDMIDLGGNRGRIKFNNNDWSYWPYIDIEINQKGEFNGTASTPLLPWITGGYVMFKMEIAGSIAAKKISASVKYDHLKGADENVTPYCRQIFEMNGFERFRLKQTAAKTSEGEYSSRVIVKKNTCLLKTPPEAFTLETVPQENGFYNLRMWEFLIADLYVEADGKFSDAVSNGIDSYSIEGELTPEEITLKLSISYGFYACEQELEIRGTRRFEESDGKDTGIDGIYGVWTHLDVNTCDNRPPTARFHMDALAVDEKTVRLVIGNKDFTAALDGKNFSGSFKEGLLSDNKFSGTITPDEITGTLSIDVDMIDFMDMEETKCSFVYSVHGYKLYKHN